jgi:hypothetical protein
MRHVLIGLALASLISGTAAAQSAANRPADGPLEVKPIAPQSDSVDSQPILTKIESVGYTHVTDLTRDSTGLWHAHAIRDNEPVDISIDKGGRIKPEIR